MGEIFGLDGGIMKFLSKVSDICIISILWLIWCFYYRSILYDGEGCQKRDWNIT